MFANKMAHILSEKLLVIDLTESNILAGLLYLRETKRVSS